MVKAGKIEIDPNAASPFKDLKDDHWARPYIAAAVKTRYISGFPDETFRPDAKITRAGKASADTLLFGDMLAVKAGQQFPW